MNLTERAGTTPIMRLLSLSAIWLIASVLLAGPVAAQAFSRSVLVLDQSSAGLPFNTALAMAIRTTLNAQSAVPVSLYSENLDANRFFGSDYEDDIISFFKRKYRDKSIDAIVVVGSAALDFILRRRAEVWPSVPVVFAAIDEATAGRVVRPPNVTGVTMQLALKDMMTVARVAVPNLKRIALVGDPLERQTFYRHFKDEIPTVATQFEIINLENLPMEELKERLQTLPDDTAVIYTGIYYDSKGVSYVPAELVKQIAEWAIRPVVINVASYLAKGAIGGYIVLPKPIGQQAAQLVLRILKGEDASKIAIIKTRSPLIFEWPALQRFGISESVLPQGSEVRFRQLTLWDQYRWQMSVIFAALLLQAALIGLLLFERRRRQIAELESRGRLRDIIHMDRVAAVGAISASIAHELNQPLGAIMANTQAAEKLLAAKPIDHDLLKEILADIRQSDQRAADIIAHLHGLLKKQDDSELQEFDLNDAIHGALHTLGPEARKRGVLVSAYHVQGALPVLADRVHLEQALINLSINAMDAMQACAPGTRKMTIQTALAGESKIEVSVSDSGTGIPIDKLKAVFDTFYTTKQKGTGLGLSIVRTIVQASGGKIWAENRPGGGSVFRFTLPLIKTHPA